MIEFGNSLKNKSKDSIKIEFKYLATLLSSAHPHFKNHTTMKKIILISALLIAALTSCTSTKQLSDADFDRISWTAFCKSYGYNAAADKNNDQTINAYLDCWRGSVAEEAAFAQLGITLYD